MNPTTTGDPNIDGLIGWLTNGGTLSSPGALIGLSFVIHSIIMPVSQFVAGWFKWKLSGPVETQFVYVSSTVLVLVVGLATHTAKSLQESVVYGIMIANIAMGIHATRTTATDAVADKKDDAA